MAPKYTNDGSLIAPLADIFKIKNAPKDKILLFTPINNIKDPSYIVRWDPKGDSIIEIDGVPEFVNTGVWRRMARTVDGINYHPIHSGWFQPDEVEEEYTWHLAPLNLLLKVATKGFYDSMAAGLSKMFKNN